MRGVDIGRFRRQGGFGLSNAGDRKVQNSTAKHDTPPIFEFDDSWLLPKPCDRPGGKTASSGFSGCCYF
jgi:hypothetical protein